MQKTRNKILASAVIILNQNDTASIEEIAMHAGVTRRTVHRYFNDRDTLITSCKEKMMAICNKTMWEAYESSDDPEIQLENMFYAALNIGAEYAFVKRTYDRSGFSESLQETKVYEDVKTKWFELIKKLQITDSINSSLTIPWIYNLFGGIIDIGIAAKQKGDIAANDMKHLSWSAFKKSIDLK